MSRRHSDYVDDAADVSGDDDEDGDDEEDEDDDAKSDAGGFVVNDNEEEEDEDGDEVVDGTADDDDAMDVDRPNGADVAAALNFYANPPSQSGTTPLPVPGPPPVVAPVTGARPAPRSGGFRFILEKAAAAAAALAAQQPPAPVAIPMDMDVDAEPRRHSPAPSPGVDHAVAASAAPRGLNTPKWPDFRQQPDALGLSFNLHSFSVALSVAIDTPNADRPFEFGLKELQEFYEYLDLDKEMPSNRRPVLDLVDKLYPSQGAGSCIASISHITHHWSMRIGTLMSFFEHLKDKFPNHTAWARDRIAQRLDQVQQTLSCLATVAESGETMRQVRHQSWSAETSPSAPLVWFDRKAMSEYCTPFQKVLLALYGKLRSRSYRIQHCNVFAPKLQEGQYVHFFTKLMSVAEFVGKEILTVESNQNWLNATQRNSTAKDVIEHFELYGHMTLPALTVSRYLFAFVNGVFDIRTCRLTPHSEVTTDEVCANYFPEVVPDSTLRVLNQPFFKHGIDWRKTNRHGTKTFDTPDPDDWITAIKTEYIDKIFDYQLCSEDNMTAPKACRLPKIELDVTKRFLWYIMARLMHNVNDLDNDQRIFSVTGQSGTGKSMIQDLCNAIYPPENIVCISPNNDTGFVLSGLERPETFMWILPEVQKDCKLKPSDFYALICGDRVSIQIKFKDSRSEVVKASGAMFGNSMNIFHHGAKRALSRRVFLLVMRRVVLQKDLNDTIKRLSLREVPQLIIKAAIAYRSLRMYMEQQVPKLTNITMVWPKYFHDNCEALVANADCMEGFLTSPHVKVDPSAVNPPLTVPLTEFRARFRQFTTEDLGMKHSPVWDESLFQSAFNQHGISLDKTTVYGVKLITQGSLEAQQEMDRRSAAVSSSSSVVNLAGSIPAMESHLVPDDYDVDTVAVASSSRLGPTLIRSAPPPRRSTNDEPLMDM